MPASHLISPTKKPNWSAGSNERNTESAERIRRMTEELAFPDFERNFSITSSFGIAQYRPGEDLKDMLSRADTALYKAKHAGRNRTLAA